MLVRSALVDLRPFRTGLVVGLVGLMIALGEDHGGGVGGALGGGLARVVGGAGVADRRRRARPGRGAPRHGRLGGALLRRSGHAVRQAGTAARRSIESLEWATGAIPTRSRPCPRRAADAGLPGAVDGVEAFPDVVGRGGVSPSRRRSCTRAGRGRADRRRRCARVRRAGDRSGVPAPRPRAAEGEPAGRGDAADVERAHGAGARADARELRRRGDRRGHDRGPARRPLRAQLAPGHEGLEGRRAQGRPLLRARDDRDPHPRADPGQAGGRRRGPEPRAAHGDARRHLRRPARARRARSPSGSARTSRATRSGPTSPGCRTS